MELELSEVDTKERYDIHVSEENTRSCICSEE